MPKCNGKTFCECQKADRVKITDERALVTHGTYTQHVYALNFKYGEIDQRFLVSANVMRLRSVVDDAAT
jgi:hypothetical protein